MTTQPGDSLDGWSIGLAEEVDIPGWLYLPSDLTAAQRTTWLAHACDSVVQLIEQSSAEPLPPSLAADVTEVLEAGLDERAQSECDLMYQVWPVAGPAAVLCEVNATTTSELPQWSQMPGRVYAAEARHIGPGLQYSTRRTLREEGETYEVSGVHFVFADDSYAFLLSLREAPSPLIAQALVPLGVFKSALAITRDDGELFTSSPRPDVVEDPVWVEEEEEVS